MFHPSSSGPLRSQALVADSSASGFQPRLCDQLNCSMKASTTGSTREGRQRADLAQFIPVLLGAALSRVLLGLILSTANRTAALFHEKQFRWKRLSILLVVLLQLAQTGTDLSRVIKVSATSTWTRA